MVWGSSKVSIPIFENLSGPECFSFVCHYCSKIWMAHRLGQYCLILKNLNNGKLLPKLQSLNKIWFTVFVVTNKIGN